MKFLNFIGLSIFFNLPIMANDLIKNVNISKLDLSPIRISILLV